jgi:hypothetical protein
MKNSQNIHLDFRRLRSQSSEVVISFRLEKRIKIPRGIIYEANPWEIDREKSLLILCLGV